VAYAGQFTAAGLAFFALLLGARQTPADSARQARWAAGAALLGLLASLGAHAAHVGVLTGGTLLDAEAWRLVATSRAGAAAALGAAGLGLVAALALGPGWTVPAALGGVLVCASYTLAGHTTELQPRALLAGLLLLHLLVAAFWIGSLAPLAVAARRGGPEAAVLVAAWSRLATIAVPVLLAAGLALAVWTLGGVRALLASAYGRALLAKLALVVVLLGFAALHRWRLTPDLAAGRPGAGRRLARSIALEAVVACLVLYAAAELVSAPPPGTPPVGAAPPRPASDSIIPA
jgi:putative copper export protein